LSGLFQEQPEALELVRSDHEYSPKEGTALFGKMFYQNAARQAGKSGTEMLQHEALAQPLVKRLLFRPEHFQVERRAQKNGHATLTVNRRGQDQKDP
jgi:hypothetical protein